MRVCITALLQSRQTGFSRDACLIRCYRFGRVRPLVLLPSSSSSTRSTLNLSSDPPFRRRTVSRLRAAPVCRRRISRAPSQVPARTRAAPSRVMTIITTFRYRNTVVDDASRVPATTPWSSVDRFLCDFFFFSYVFSSSRIRYLLVYYFLKSRRHLRLAASAAA